MLSAQEFAIFMYNLTLIPVIFFSVLFLLLALANMFISKEKKPASFSGKFPFVSVQIPVYNDDVASSCIERCMRFDYPKNRYEIIIVDDSSNGKIIRKLKGYSIRNPGFVKYIHRDNRDGFKAGLFSSGNLSQVSNRNQI